MIRLPLQSLTWLAAIGLSSASPAAATEGLDCVVDLIGDQRKSELASTLRADAVPTEALQAALRAAMQACTDLHDWNVQQQEAISDYSVARALLDILVQTAPFPSADLERLGTAFDTIDPAVAQQWFERGVVEMDDERLIAAIEMSGVALDDSNVRFAAEFLILRHTIASARAAFDAL